MDMTEELVEEAFTFVEEPDYGFTSDEVEYLELESLIEKVADRLNAEWSFDAEEVVYKLELPGEDAVALEPVSVYTEICTDEGLNEGRELLVCEVFIGNCDEEDEELNPLELLVISEQLIFSRIYLTTEKELFLCAKTLSSEVTLDLLTAMVEEVAAFTEVFREEVGPI